jgi:hypothetical protein
MSPPYQPVGQCIYCGATRYGLERKKLGEEHIVPYCVDGTHILPEASCKRCEVKTGGLEQSLFGNAGFYRAARVAARTKSRRKGPNTVPLWIGPDGNQARYDIPADEAPLSLTAVHFGPPAILNGGGWYTPDKNVAIHHHQLNSHMPRPGESIVTPNIQLDSLQRLMAKIGHGYAVAELGLTGFTPFLIDCILGREENHPWGLFGCVDDPAQPSGAYQIGLSEWPVNDDVLIAVDVRLFGTLPFPRYRVVVGRKGQDDKPIVREEIVDREGRITSLAFTRL